MLKKLLKYDLKAIGNSLFPIYGITIALAVLARIFIEIENISAVFRMPTGLVTGLSILLTMALPFVTFIIGIDRFNKQTAKDEGYLTHTLPVKKSTIISSKLIAQTLFEILAMIVVFISICIIGNISFHEIKNLIETIFEIFAEYKVLTPALFMLIALAGYEVITLLVYTAISFGQRHATNKGKFAVLYRVILYVAQQCITALVFTPLLRDESFIAELEKTLPSATVLNISLGISLGVLIITAVCYFIITTVNFDKKLNLE